MVLKETRTTSTSLYIWFWLCAKEFNLSHENNCAIQDLNCWGWGWGGGVDCFTPISGLCAHFISYYLACWIPIALLRLEAGSHLMQPNRTLKIKTYMLYWLWCVTESSLPAHLIMKQKSQNCLIFINISYAWIKYPQFNQSVCFSETVSTIHSGLPTRR